MEFKHKILIAGSLVLDILPRFVNEDGEEVAHTLLAQGKLTESSDFVVYLGGEVGNTGLALEKLGVPVTLMSKVGDDSIGKIVAGLMAASKSEVLLTEMENTKSTASIALALPGRDKSTIHLRGASQLFCAGDFTKKVFFGHKVFHFGYPTTMKYLFANDGEQLEQIMRLAHESGIVTSMDTSLPDLKAEPGKVNWKPILERVLPYVDLFLPSLEEALFMTDRERYVKLVQEAETDELLPLLGDEDICNIAEQMLCGGAKIVLIKCGSRGMYLRTAGKEKLEKMDLLSAEQLQKWSNRELWCSPFKVMKVKSTTGAGDTALAGFLTGLLGSLGPEESLNLAAFTAARCVSSWDTTGNIEKAENMIREMEGKERATPDLAENRWMRSAYSGIYNGISDSGNSEGE